MVNAVIIIGWEP